MSFVYELTVYASAAVFALAALAGAWSIYDAWRRRD